MKDYNEQVEKLRKASETLNVLADFLTLINGKALADMLEDAANSIEKLST